MRERYESRGLGFLAISLHPDAADVRAAAGRYGIRMPIAIAQSELLAPLGVKGVPSTLFIDREGRIVAAASGARSRAFFEERARELLSKDKK